MSRVTATEVEMMFYIAFDEQGRLRMTRTEGGLERGEKQLQLTLKVPRTLWRAPQLKAVITVDAPGQPNPVIDIAAANAAIREVTGLDIDIRVASADDK